MALLSTWSDANKVTETALCVTYQPVNGQIVDFDGTGMLRQMCFQIRRHATKRYSYVGMTEQAAIACRDAKIAQYTREKKLWAVSGNVGVESVSTIACQADVVATRSSGDMWDVSISVNENDDVWIEQTLLEGQTIPAFSSLFDIEQDYDE